MNVYDLLNQRNPIMDDVALDSVEGVRTPLPKVTWAKLDTPPRTPFADPVVEALYQASFVDDDSLNEPLNAYDDAEQIVAIVRAAIAKEASA
jgi:hypothetical protein